MLQVIHFNPKLFVLMTQLDYLLLKHRVTWLLSMFQAELLRQQLFPHLLNLLFKQGYFVMLGFQPLLYRGLIPPASSEVVYDEVKRFNLIL